MNGSQWVADVIAETELVDHHCHGVMKSAPDREAFELLATESDWPSPTGATIFDSPVGLTIRNYCGPLIDLPANATAEDYWNRRVELGNDEVNRRLLGSTKIHRYLVDTGFRSDAITTPGELAGITGAGSDEIVRLEAVAEQLAPTTTAQGFERDFAAALESAAAGAVGFKSIMAYRYGLDFDPEEPTSHEVAQAAGEWLAAPSARGGDARMDHPVLLRHLLWVAVGYAKPLQFHVGYGDSDITLHRCDPSRMTEFIRRTRTTGASIMLLHCHPFVSEASFLAQVYPHVYIDTGAAANYTGWSSHHLIRQSLELAPFHKVLFSSDAFGLPELYACGAMVWRRGLTRLFGEWLDDGGLSQADCQRYVRWIARENALSAYALGGDA